MLDFGFPDHHSPPLEMLFRIIGSIHEYLNADPENVAVVHCIGGKGRTGTVIACYLAYSGEFATMDEVHTKHGGITRTAFPSFHITLTSIFLLLNLALLRHLTILR